jgi:hypothetical protein
MAQVAAVALVYLAKEQVVLHQLHGVEAKVLLVTEVQVEVMRQLGLEPMVVRQLEVHMVEVLVDTSLDQVLELELVVPFVSYGVLVVRSHQQILAICNQL